MEGLATYCLPSGSLYTDWLFGSVECAIVSMATLTELGVE